MRHRFCVQNAGVSSGTVVLPPDEAEHATRVLRLRVGAPVGVFDGHGREFTAVVVAVGKRMEVRIDAEVPPAPEPVVAVTLVHAVLKGDKMDGVVRDAVMLGAAAIRPVVTRRSETSVAALARGHRVDRWRRVALASAKQCGRAVVPEVFDAGVFTPTREWFEAQPLPAPWLALTEPGAHAKATTPAGVARPPRNRLTLLVGPEGGWAPDELEALAGSCEALTLGPRTLRADAAAIVALAALFAVWDVE